MDDCKNFGTLPFAHLAREAFISISILKSAVEMKIISQDALDSFMSSIKTVSHQFTDDLKEAQISQDQIKWDLFYEKYGHLRPGTYDITSLSYLEAKEKYLSKNGTLDTQNNSYDLSIWDSEKNFLFQSLRNHGLNFSNDLFEKFLYKSIEGREYSKFIFTKKSFISFR